MESIKTLLISDMAVVTMDSIVYIDDGIQKKLDLHQCAKNYANEYNSRLDKDSTAQLLDVESNRCVGEHNWLAERPYFVFFDNPKVKFEIVPQKRLLDSLNKNWRQRYYPDFLKIQTVLQQFKWHTFDLG